MLEMQLFMNNRKKKRETKQNDGGGQNNNDMDKEFGRTHANEKGRNGEWKGGCGRGRWRSVETFQLVH